MRWVLSWEQPKPMAGYMSKHTQALVYRFLGLKNGPHGIESTRWNRKVFWTCWATDLSVSYSENYSLSPFKKDEVCIQSKLLLFLKNCHHSASTLNSDQGPRPALTSLLHQLLWFLSSSISSFSFVLSKYFVLICWAELRRGLEIKRWKSLSSETAETFFEVLSTRENANPLTPYSITPHFAMEERQRQILFREYLNRALLSWNKEAWGVTIHSVLRLDTNRGGWDSSTQLSIWALFPPSRRHAQSISPPSMGFLPPLRCKTSYKANHRQMLPQSARGFMLFSSKSRLSEACYFHVLYR